MPKRRRSGIVRLCESSKTQLQFGQERPESTRTRDRHPRVSALKPQDLVGTLATRCRSVPVEETFSQTGIWAFESRHGEAFSMSTTAHRFPKLLLIREGSGHIEGDWGRLPCKTGDCVLVPPGLRHRIVDRSNHAISLYGLGIATRLFHCVPEMLAELPAGVFPAEQLKSLGVEHRLRRILYVDRRPDPASRLASVAASLELFAEVCLALRRAVAPTDKSVPESPRADDALLSAYLGWIEHHFFEPLTLDSAAAACGMSRRHFTTMFKQRVGMTWLAYLHHLRVRHATELLRHTDRKITSVAFQCGF
ncbi:MAG: helix-turn-helix domain-containing protein, partial [Planctomycetaceae bacterium]